MHLFSRFFLLILPNKLLYYFKYSCHSQKINISQFYRLIDDKTGIFNIDKDLLTKLSKNVPKKPSLLKRDLDARKYSFVYTLRFRLPQTERLDGTEECTLWTPYDKKHNWGLLYLSQNFICFDSRVSFTLYIIDKSISTYNL